MKEIWRSVLDYEGVYEVSNYGQVRSLTRRTNNGSGQGKTSVGQVLKPYNNRRYKQVNLWRAGKNIRAKVHRLVAQAFIHNPLNKPQINHIDSDPANNRVDNLEWATQAENNMHNIKAGRRNHAKGSAHYYAKLTEAQVAEIKKLLRRRANGETIKLRDIAAQFSTTEQGIQSIKTERTWKHVVI